MVTSRLVQGFRALSDRLSDEGLTQKAYLNALAVGLDYAARLAVGFFVAPLMVAGLGDYLYGAWQVLGRLGGYISAASGRPTQALKWTIAHEQASDDYSAKRRGVGSAVAVWLAFQPVLALAGGLLAWRAPFLLEAPTEHTLAVSLAAGLLVANLMVFGLAEIPQSVLRGENLGYKRMGLATVIIVLGGGLTALALRLGMGIVGVAAANLVNTLLAGTLFFWITKASVPWLGVAKPAGREIVGFLGLSWWFVAWRVVNQLMMSSDVVVLGMLDSVELVTVYSLTKYAPETLVSLVALVVGGVTPGLGGVIGSGDHKKAVRVRGEIMSLTWLIATAIGVTIVLWNQAFVQLWVGIQYRIGATINVLVVLMVMQLVLIRNDAFIIDLTLDLGRKVALGAVSVLVSLAASVVLLRYLNLGLLGLCLGFIAGRFLLTLGYPWLVGRVLGVKLRHQIVGALRPALTTAVLVLLASRLGMLLDASTWLGLIPSVGLTLVVSVLAAFYAGLTSTQRGRIVQRARVAMRIVAPDQ
jgi:O-antigen/teichoic acid export membrane protein